MANIKEFPITVYGNFTKVSDTISRARCRIFYKYENRNGGFITDEFAEKLLATLPYAPVKGIYDEFNEDFGTHGNSRTEGRIYGIVPENPNVSWEIHEDEDGVKRSYACADVYLFSALYPEASKIEGKSQSMELYEPSIKGSWKMVNGRRIFEYTDASFLGLQVLGDEAEPCFEGSAFFTYDSLQKIVQEIENFNLKLQQQKEGGQFMPNTINFKLSDGVKHDLIWNALNPDYNEEGGWTVYYAVTAIYDEYALCFNYEAMHYERIYYTKDDEAETVTLGDTVTVYIVDVTESEKNTLDTIQRLNGGSFEKADETFEKVPELTQQVEEFTAQVAEFETKVNEFTEQISTLENEKAEFTAQLETEKQSVADLTEQVEALNTYKLTVETNEKEEVIISYEKLLPEDIIESYRSKISEFTAVDLDKEMAYELKKSNISVFSAPPAQGRIPKDNIPPSGIEAILSKYKK